MMCSLVHSHTKLIENYTIILLTVPKFHCNSHAEIKDAYSLSLSLSFSLSNTLHCPFHLIIDNQLSPIIKFVHENVDAFAPNGPLLLSISCRCQLLYQ